jgi:hypothetical protein
MASQFNSEKVLAKINEIENSFPVNEWNVNGLRVWPYLRTALAYTQNRNPDTRKTSGKKKRTPFRKIRKYALILLRLPFEYFSFKRKLRTATRLFFGSVSYRAKINGLFFNRFYDLAIDDFRKDGVDCVALDNSFLEDKSEYYNQDALFGLPTIYLVAEIKRRLSLTRPTYVVHLPRYEEFYEHLLKIFEHTSLIRQAFNKAAVIRRTSVLHYRTEFLKRLLQGSAVQRVYFLCYYSSLFYPVIAAGNALGIITTDIQHGGMGEGHYSYGRWLKSPREGYELLPRFFWTWDKHSAEMINTWATKTDFNRAIPAGNPWNDACLRIYDAALPPSTDYILLNMTNVTLDPFLVETVRNFGPTRRWVLRMHPRQYQHHRVLKQQVEDEGISDFVRIEDSSAVPLPVSLRYCTHFVSKASGSVIEAIELGRRPILLRSEIMSYYEHYVRNGEVVVLSEDAASYLIEQLKQDDVSRSIKWDSVPVEDKFHKFEREAQSLTLSHGES